MTRDREPIGEKPTQGEGAASEREEASAKRIDQGRAMYQSYYRWLRISRLLMGAFIALSVIYFLWVIPWVPRGFDTGDYSPEVSFTVYLIVSIVLLGMFTLAIREWAWRKRESLMTWSIVYDSATGLHNRPYFIDRLTLECDRSNRSGREFSVLTISIRPVESDRGKAHPISDATMRRIGEAIDRKTHASDLVGHLSATELAVLAIDVDRDNRHGMLTRIRDAVAEELEKGGDHPRSLVVTGGAATYGVDGTEPSALIHAARAAASLGSASARTSAPSHAA